VIGFEAMVRWQHTDPRRNFARLVNSSPRDRLIIQIGEWVLRKAC